MAAPSSPATTALASNCTPADADDAAAAVNSNNDVTITRPTKRLKPQEENDEQKNDDHVISSAASPDASSHHCSIDNNNSSSSLLDNSSSSSTAADSSDSDNIISNDFSKRPPSSIIDLCISRLFHPLPQTLLADDAPNNNNNNNDKVASFRSQWTNHGFRTTVVSSPRSAVSVYLDSCGVSGTLLQTHKQLPSSSFFSSEGEDENEKRSSSAQYYDDDEAVMEMEAGRQFLVTCIAMHSQQAQMEGLYQSVLMKCWCFNLFLKKLTCCVREDNDSMREESICNVVSDWKDELTTLIEIGDDDDPNNCDTNIIQTKKKKKEMMLLLLLQQLSNKVPTILSNLIAKLTDIDHSLRTEQLLQEYNRIEWENSSLANACFQRWLSTLSSSKNNGGCPYYDLDQVYFKFSPPGRYLPKYERITIYFKDENDPEVSRSSSSSNNKLVLIPSLAQILNRNATKISSHPIDTVVQDMIQTTWDTLLHNGYYVDQTRKDQLTPSLSKFYTSGLISGETTTTKNNNANNVMPLLLNAHFTPTYPLSLYLHGLAGSGKSSLVRNLFVAMNAAISKYCDPELLVRFVKQNLNKPYGTLDLELELRPNNNDYSVMSIIQGRRMTLTQSKPGLVVVGLEEMPSNVEGSDPRQCDVSSLLSYRFSGRKGNFKSGGAAAATAAPRNSSKRGISGDATIITLFTSNYELESSSLETLSKLEMFQNLCAVKIEAVSGQDRHSFALSYLIQRLKETVGCKNVAINLDIDCGEGDIRPLVRYLRMLSFYICALLKQQQRIDYGDIDVSVTQNVNTSLTQITNNQNGGSMQLKYVSLRNLYAVTPCVLDPRASDVMTEIQKNHPDLADPSDLCQILDFYFARTLAPVVILSRRKELITDLTSVLARSEEVRAIRNIDPSSYKIMRSLYDSSDTPNLRDEILQLQRDGGGHSQSLVTVELKCHTNDSQMIIREIIEDTPSMTAFSSERSALHKDGLLFCVYVEGDITPEIASRASLII